MGRGGWTGRGKTAGRAEGKLQKKLIRVQRWPTHKGKMYITMKTNTAEEENVLSDKRDMV